MIYARLTLTPENWIALAGIAVAAIVTILTTILTFWAGIETRRDTRDVARQNRLFERRRDVYVELLEYALALSDKVRNDEEEIGPMAAVAKERRPPPGPPGSNGDELRKIEARIEAFASPEVKSERDKLRAAHEAWMAIEFSNRHGATQAGLDEATEARAIVQMRVRKTIDVVNAELVGLPPVSPWPRRIALGIVGVLLAGLVALAIVAQSRTATVPAPSPVPSTPASVAPAPS